MNDNTNWPNPPQTSRTRSWQRLALPFRLAVASVTIPIRLVQAVVQSIAGRTPDSPKRSRARRTVEKSPEDGRPQGIRRPDKPALRQIAQPELGLLDLNSLVVLGDGLAAGMGEFALQESSQVWSFPAQLSCHMGVELRQPLIEAPGLECPVLSWRGGVRPPEVYQTTVLKEYPPAALPANLSTPGMTMTDAVNRRVREPIVCADDKFQTAANMIFGLPLLMKASSERHSATMLDAACAQGPAHAIVALGFSDFLKAAFEGVALEEEEIEEMIRSAETILERLTELCSTTIVSSIPSPLDTAAFSTPESAAAVLKVSAGFLRRRFGLEDLDRLTIAGLVEIGNQMISKSYEGLREAHVLRGTTAVTLGRQVDVLNQHLNASAKSRGCLFFDLAGLFCSLSTSGIVVGSRRLTNNYLGGFFSLNGIYPGPTGHALIANGIIDLLCGELGSRIRHIDVAELARWDPIAQYQPARGPDWEHPDTRVVSPPPVGVALVTPENRHHCEIYPEPRIDGLPDAPLVLPLGMEQELPLTSALSYHGDGMRIVDCVDPEVARFGGSGELRFDGLALFGSHLHGSLKFTFSPPSDGVTHFTVAFSGGTLEADDGILSTPGFYRFPLLEARVVQPPGMLASGELDLTTGRVQPNTLKLFCIYQNSGLAEIARLNPVGFPNPAVITFSNESGNPRVYGSSWAQFRQRQDGKLDFVFHGTAFVPLGPGAVFPLPFPSALGTYPIVSVSGTSLHPHLHLSTVEPAGQYESAGPIIPTNRTEEFELCTARSSFGDLFRLNHPVLGEGLGRSFLAGRLRIQFGERFADSIPFSVSFLPPAGLFDSPSHQPLQGIFPSRLTRGLIGHDGILHYPLRNYSLSDTYLLEDPLDIALGAVDIHSGVVIGDFLHRGLIGQDLIFALFRVEPRTPKASFQFRGEARFFCGRDGQLRFALGSAVYIPYPEGFLFPLPNLATGVPIGPGSSLDPYLQLETVNAKRPARKLLIGREVQAVSATNIVFSFEYALALGGPIGEAARFHFINHSDGDAQFDMDSVAALTVLNADAEDNPNDQNVISFTCYGRWSKDPDRLHAATVEISRHPRFSYVSIQIDGGRVINVDTRPEIIQPPLTPVH